MTDVGDVSSQTKPVAVAPHAAANQEVVEPRWVAKPLSELGDELRRERGFATSNNRHADDHGRVDRFGQSIVWTRWLELEHRGLLDVGGGAKALEGEIVGLQADASKNACAALRHVKGWAFP